MRNKKWAFAMPLVLCAIGIVSMGAGKMIMTAHAADAFVTLDSFSGLPGSTVNVSGGNYTPGETVNIFMGSLSGNPVASSTARGDSLFGPVPVTIPANATQGSLVIAAVGASSTLSANNTFYVDPLSPAITATSTANTPESIVYVSGTGYVPNESVQISLGSSTATTTTNGSGAFYSVPLTIPFGAPGSQMITAVGVSSQASASAYFYVGGFYPTVSPSSYFAVPGDPITFSGSGFAPTEPVNVFEDGSASSTASFSTDASGAFYNAGPILIPFGLTSTSTTFDVVGASSTASTSVTIGLGTLNPLLTPSVYYLQRGNSFTVTASGFAPDESVSVSTYGNATDTVPANASGTAQAGPFMVPLSASSTMVINAIGNSSGATASTSITVGNDVAQQLASSTLNIAFAIDNTAGGSATSSDFTIAVTGADANPASFAGSTSSTAVTIDGDTDFSVTATSSLPDYVLSTTGNCAGQIPSTESDTCTLTETYVVPPPAMDIQPSSGFSDGTVGDAYSQTISASTTAMEPFTWSVASGTLPDGITLDTSSTASTTSISGTPTTAGIYTFTIAAASGSSTAQQSYTLNIDAAPSSAPSAGTTVVSSGGGGGGGVYYYPSAITTTANTTSTATSTDSVTDSTTTASTGLVLGASAVNIPALRFQLLSLEQQLVSVRLASVSMSCPAPFDRNLKEGMMGADVQNLQRLLNESGVTQVAASGPGSPGNETTYFGPATAKAVIAFQNIFANQILAPYGLTAGNGFVGPSTRAELNSLCSGGAGTGVGASATSTGSTTTPNTPSNTSA